MVDGLRDRGDDQYDGNQVTITADAELSNVPRRNLSAFPRDRTGQRRWARGHPPELTGIVHEIVHGLLPVRRSRGLDGEVPARTLAPGGEKAQYIVILAAVSRPERHASLERR